MPTVTFICADDSQIAVDAGVGSTVMDAAKAGAVPGIEATCGGACSCATCHVHVGEAWTDRVGPPNDSELDMLDLAENVGPSSRLSCQIRVTDTLDGLVVRVVGER